MKNTLETRLAEYEVKRPISCDGELIAALGEIIEKERRKSRRDLDLIDEALTFLYELSGTDAKPSPELSVLPEAPAGERSAAVGSKIRWALPAAAIAVALAGAAAGALRADEPEMSDELKEEIMSMEPGDVLETDGWEIAAGYDAGDIKTAEELASAVAGDGIMLPRADGYTVTVTRFEDYGKYKTIGLELVGENGRNEVEIRTEDTFQEVPETVRIGKFDVAVFTYDDPAMTGNVIHQGSFVHNGNTYNVWAVSGEDLERIIVSFEEIAE